jgi:hypothetical protein
MLKDVDEMVQTVTASKSSSQFMLATTSMEGDGMVRVWTKERKVISSKWEMIRLLLLFLIAIVFLHSVLKVSQSICLVDQPDIADRDSPKS